jgi:hypothetical protein
VIDGNLRVIEYQPAETPEQMKAEAIDRINSISIGIIEIQRQQLEAIQR